MFEDQKLKCSDSHIRRFTEDNMLECLYLELQVLTDSVQDALQDIEDIKNLINKLEGFERFKENAPIY